MKVADLVARLRRSPPAAGSLYAARARIAAQYLRGAGVEFGALHAGLSMPPGVRVTYADIGSAKELHTSYAQVGAIRPPDIVTDLESMAAIADASQDFVVANHVLEHVEDPLRALAATARVLRPGGIAFIALPDMRFTFDAERRITPLDHLIRDYEEGPEWSLAGHYDEWCRQVDRLDGEALARKVAAMRQVRTNIHFHVWDYPAMLGLFAYVAKEADFGLDIELSMLNEIEVIWILRRRSDRPGAPDRAAER